MRRCSTLVRGAARFAQHARRAVRAPTALHSHAKLELQAFETVRARGRSLANLPLRYLGAHTDDHGIAFLNQCSADFAHLRLQIVLQTHLAHQLDLGFEEVDVLLGVVQNALQQVA